MIRSRTPEPSLMLDLTPVIDMVFLLLIFFLAATTFQQNERELNVALPSAASAAPISASLRELIVNIDSSGEIILAGRRTTPEALRDAISAAVRANPSQKVSIRGDRRASYEHIVRALDICKGAGVQEPYLDTIHAP